MPHKYQSISLGLFGLGTRRVLMKRLAIWPRIFKPISAVKSEPLVPTAIEETRRKYDRRILGTASSENAIFHCKNMTREIMYSSSCQAGATGKRGEKLRTDVHSFVFQVFIYFSIMFVFWLSWEGNLGLPDKPLEQDTRPSLASLEKCWTYLFSPKF